MYDTAEYANTRLSGTIVRLTNGTPIVVHQVRDKFIVEYSKLEDKEGELKKCPLSQVDLEPVPLGFVNRQGGATYLSRQPKRDDWRQGLRDNTINQQPQRARKLYYAEIHEAIVGCKMNVTDAVRMSLANKNMVAFHRYWAVDRDRLMHKWYTVGVITEQGDVTFTEKYKYLESRYAEDVKYA